MYQFVYCEINLLCVLILLYILIHMNYSADHQASNQSFKQVVCALMLLLLLDACWSLLEGVGGALARTLNLLVNALYFTLTGVAAYCWRCFTDAKLQREQPRFSFLQALPLILLSLLSFASIWTGWLFTVNEDNLYQRGPYHLLQVLLAYTYLVCSAVHILQGLVRCPEKQQRSEYFTLLSVFFPPVLGSILGIFVFGLPLVWPLSALSLLMVFINLQGYQISTDSLTGLNNRRKFDSWLHAATLEASDDRHLILFLMDIDSFKGINDTLGHSEGDSALREAAALLKSICSGYNLFLARYGGDEFAIVASFAEADMAFSLKEEIQAAFSLRNQTSATTYPLTLSIGMAEYRPPAVATIPDLIAKADKMLYQEKGRKKHAASS